MQSYIELYGCQQQRVEETTIRVRKRDFDWHGQVSQKQVSLWVASPNGSLTWSELETLVVQQAVNMTIAKHSFFSYCKPQCQDNLAGPRNIVGPHNVVFCVNKLSLFLLPPSFFLSKMLNTRNAWKCLTAKCWRWTPTSTSSAAAVTCVTPLTSQHDGALGTLCTEVQLWLATAINKWSPSKNSNLHCWKLDK